jgi:ubiquinone biosynthesis protein Coq4
MTAALDRDFAPYLLRAFDDPQQYGVHQLFNDWWRFAPEEVKAKYAADFEAIPEQRAFVEEAWYAEPLELAALAALPPGSLGRAYHDFIVENGLEKNIARNYRAFHRALEAAGLLSGMPEPMRYAVLRGFQTHDFQHVVTGFDSSPRGEIALQAFCLGQIRFPYFGMWMSVVTTRMTFLDPDVIRPAMDAITAGWQLARRISNIQFEKWERQLERPLGEVRRQHGLAPGGLRPLDG